MAMATDPGATRELHMYEPVPRALSNRYLQVTSLTQKYYTGDVVPPSTKSQVLRAQKWAVLYYYLVNACFFVYAFLIPAQLRRLPYGGLNPLDFHAEVPHLVIMALVIIMPMIRFVILSWSSDFYHWGFALAGLEGAVLFFVAAFWSRGLPVLLVLAVANMANIVISQLYWRRCFARVVGGLEALVPPSAFRGRDHTSVTCWPGFRETVADFKRLWGFDVDRTEATLWDERSGIFSGKECARNISYVAAMSSAYWQALNPWSKTVPWENRLPELWGLHPQALLEGLLNTFISNAAFCMAGLWLGQAVFVTQFRGAVGCCAALVMVVIYFFSATRAKHWLQEGLGVAVAEKEWLAHDVVQHQGDAQELALDALDVAESGDQSITEAFGIAAATRSSAGLSSSMRGRLNLTFMWLCVASVADFIGESYLGKMYWNLATESRYMIEAMTPYSFKLFAHAQWEATIMGIVLKIMQTFVLAVMSAIYFGTYFAEAELPGRLLGTIGAACFLHSVVKLIEVMRFSFTILGRGNANHRKSFVSESIVLVIFFVLLINITVWFYLLPMMQGWDFPIGQCQASVNRWLFPGVCGQATA